MKTNIGCLLYAVLQGDLQQGGEVGQPGLVGSPQDGQLGQVHVETALLGADRQQLTVVGPLDPVQAALVLQGDDGVDLLQVSQVMDLDAEVG